MVCHFHYAVMRGMLANIRSILSATRGALKSMQSEER